MYGSSDKKNDSILNGMIHLADQISNTIHMQMKAINHRKSGSDECQYYTDGRQWDNIPVDL